jgi:hypothetical protein
MGVPVPGHSVGQAQAARARVAAQTLSKGFCYEWTMLPCQGSLPANRREWRFRWTLLLMWCSLRGTKARPTLRDHPVPLLTSVGAGAEMRQGMGIAVFSFMIGWRYRAVPDARILCHNP